MSAEQRSVIEHFAEVLIPQTDTPGAREAGVPAFIEGMLAEVVSPEELKAVRVGLDEFSARVLRSAGKAFTALAPAAQAAEVEHAKQLALGEHPGAEGALYAQLHALTVQGFARSRVGATRVLRYEPIPGAYHGCVSLESLQGRAWATR